LVVGSPRHALPFRQGNGEPFSTGRPTHEKAGEVSASRPNLRLLEGAPAPSEEVPATDEDLFRRYSPYVARIGLRMLGRESDVDDLIQEVFLAAFRQRHQIRDPLAIKGWLATIAVRSARKQLRRRRLRSFIGLDSLAPALELRDGTMAPDRRALLSRVYHALDQIPVEARLAWTLRYVEGQKLEQVAQHCRCSLATAKRRIAAAHGRLQTELDDG
jgi:RNA polymerase sigma-70 factor (ECF subfamily)